MGTRHAVALFILLLLGCGDAATSVAPSPTQAPAPVAATIIDPQQKIATVQADVKKIVVAANAGDLDTILHYTLPRLVELGGGETQVKKSLGDAVQQMLAAGEKTELVAFPSEPKFGPLHNDGEFVIVPVRIKTTIRNESIEVDGYQLGVRPPHAARWHYVDGSKLDLARLRVLVPGFPADYKLPEVVVKRVQ